MLINRIKKYIERTRVDGKAFQELGTNCNPRVGYGALHLFFPYVPLFSPRDTIDPAETALADTETAVVVKLPNLQSGNIILLGNFRFNPWVQAFEPKMNFYFTDSVSELTNSILMNRSPHSNELAIYRSTDVNHVHTEFCIIAFQPNPSGSGDALLLEGQSQSSTEAAEEFVQNDADLLPFLNKIRRKDGSIPYFELLLKVKGMSGNSASYEMLAQRFGD